MTTVETRPKPTDDAHFVDFLQLQAQRMLGMSEWKCVVREAVEGGFLLKGGVYNEVFKSGPRKGRPNYKKPTDGTERTVIITHAQRDEFQDQWERDTGKCARCYGTGQQIAGWHREGGSLTHDCRKCGATGKAVRP